MEANIWSAVGSFAWPIALIVVLYLFRDVIGKTIPRLRKASLSGVELERPIEQQEQALAHPDQKEGRLNKSEILSNTVLKDLPGVQRSSIVAAVEKEIHEKYAALNELKFERIANELADTWVRYFFETRYRLIFGSQITALKRLNEVGSIDEDSAKLEYAALVERVAPELNGLPFESWSSFLLGTFVRKTDAGRFELTPAGRDFLVYMTLNGLSDQKPL